MAGEDVYLRLIEQARRIDVKRLLTSFGFLHVVNTSLNILYSLALLLVLARILPSERYAQIVFFTGMSLYFQPVDQALGRVSFVGLRTAMIRKSRPRQDIVLMLGLQLVVLAIAAICIPLAVARWQGANSSVGNSFYLFFALLTNYWAFDLQSSAFALELGPQFVRWSILHRICQFMAIGVLFTAASFNGFAVVAAGLFTAFTAFACVRMVRRLEITSWSWRPEDWRGQIKIIRTSLLSSMADLLSLNLPYAVISITFGVGSVLVVFDTVMKLARLAMAGSRTLAEVVLPRHSRLVIEQETASANRLFNQLVLLCVLASAVPAAIVALEPRFVFSLLLGPNNVVPAEAGIAAGVIILATGLYQPASLLMSFTNDYAAIGRFIVIIGVMSAIFFCAVVALHPGVLQVLWGYAALLTLSGISAAALGQTSGAPSVSRPPASLKAAWSGIPVSGRSLRDGSARSDDAGR